MSITQDYLLRRKEEGTQRILKIYMDEIYEWLNPRVSIEYILLSSLVLCVAIVVVMLKKKKKKVSIQPLFWRFEI